MTCAQPLSFARLLRTLSLAASTLGLLFLVGCSKSEKPAASAPTAAAPAAPATPPAPPKPRFAVIETDLGTIEFEFFPSDSPKSVENFQLLAERGYYNGITFHRIVKDFMIQTGDPQGDGRGGESAWGGFYDEEINKNSPLYNLGNGYKRGIVAMANTGRPGTNGSQFFIVHKDYRLPPSYVIFGRVTKGIEVVDALAEVKTERGMDGGMSKPIKPPVMKRVSLKP